MREEFKKEIESKFKAAEVTLQKKQRLAITANKELISSLLGFLKEKGFGHLSLISCVDWIEDKEFELVYHISSYQNRLHLMLKTRIPRNNPKYMSIIPVFKNAQTYEREIWEMFGIKFEKNPRLIPLFLDRWKRMPPFRKDFDTRKYVKEVFGVESRQTSVETQQ